MLIEISSRLHSPEVRDEAIAACEELLRYDGITADEHAFLETVTETIR